MNFDFTLHSLTLSPGLLTGNIKCLQIVQGTPTIGTWNILWKVEIIIINYSYYLINFELLNLQAFLWPCISISYLKRTLYNVHKIFIQPCHNWCIIIIFIHIYKTVINFALLSSTLYTRPVTTTSSQNYTQSWCLCSSLKKILSISLLKSWKLYKNQSKVTQQNSDCIKYLKGIVTTQWQDTEYIVTRQWWCSHFA